MKNQNEENLEKLFGKFFGEREAKEATEQLKKVEQALQDNPTPSPCKELIASINNQIVRGLHERKQRSFRGMVYKVAAVAAAIIILAIFSIKSFENKQVKPTTLLAAIEIVPTEVWNGEDITENDADLLTLTAEIEQAEKEILAMKFDEAAANGTNELTEIEIELMEIDNDFWKG